MDAVEKLDVKIWRPDGEKWAFEGCRKEPVGKFTTWKDAQAAARQHYRPITIDVWTIEFAKHHDNKR